MYVRNVEITDVKTESRDVNTLFFDHSFRFIPGQYVMVWIRGVDEIPMSLSYANGITVRAVGDATAAICALRVGDTLGVRGPFGNGFRVTKPPVLLVAGGVGAAPLAPLAESLKNNIITILGAKTEEELLFIERFKSAGSLWITTDDGSAGHKGPTIDLLDRIQGYNEIMSCGPEKMMRKVLDHAIVAGVPSQFSLQRHIKCGVGLCGSCCIDPSGLRVCSDGPVFAGAQLQEGDFGAYMRDATGRKVNL
ncbi:MAG: dihydroorotate dehydrogenase electron transfer subunit [Halobacteriota archaeon]|jgi:dihydroorotate dehydrogenase electron transfer subunit